MRASEIKVASNPMTGILRKKGKRHEKMEAQIRAKFPQTTDCPRLLAHHQRLEETRKDISLQASDCERRKPRV